MGGSESDIDTAPATAEMPAAAKSNKPFRVVTIGQAVDGNDGDEFEGADEISGSLCMACGGAGTTRMLTTQIPFFREIILSSFECDDCHWRNNEVQSNLLDILVSTCWYGLFISHVVCF